MKRTLSGLAFAAVISGCAISTQQEIQMGTEYAQQINAQLPIVQDPEVVRYINVLGDSIAKLADDRNLDWQFFVVNASEVNAFAVPGGYVYVNRGLIDRATKMDELAGVLGHEIGHVTRRHSVKQMEQAQGANVGVTLACVLTNVCNSQAAATAINVGGSALFAKFSRDDEAQAEEEGVKNVVRRNRSARDSGDVSHPARRAGELALVGELMVRDAPARGRSHHRDRGADREDQPGDPERARAGQPQLPVVQAAGAFAAAPAADTEDWSLELPHPFDHH
jgi:Peptidase family M48